MVVSEECLKSDTKPINNYNITTAIAIATNITNS